MPASNRPANKHREIMPKNALSKLGSFHRAAYVLRAAIETGCIGIVYQIFNPFGLVFAQSRPAP